MIEAMSGIKMILPSCCDIFDSSVKSDEVLKIYENAILHI